jgi:L-lactate dehydrogenase complex protein LldE
MRTAVFATCLVDLFRPSVGFAAVELLEQAGCEVVVPPEQTCCGQPAFNNGDQENARAIARQVIDAFAGFDYVVVPSGSCGGMIKIHYPELFQDDPAYQAKARALASRCYELTHFLTDVLGVSELEATYPGKLTYHDSCSCLRELGIKQQPRTLLAQVKDLELAEMAGTENCCGFGGTFCVKYPEISTHMVDAKLKAIEQSGAGTLAAADLGCLLNIAGRLKRQASPVKVFHIAEILAGMAEGTGIGGDESP